MSTELAIPNLVSASETDLAQVLKSSDYLPRLSVMGSSSDLVKEQKLPIGHMGLIWSNDRFKDLGTSVDVLSLSVRTKAIRLTNPPMAYFQVDHPEFKKIQAESDLKDSKCSFGPEFLLWIPSVNELATFHMGSKSARREAPNLVSLMRPNNEWIVASATIKPKYIKGTSYSWHAPSVIPCTTPLAPPEDMDELREQLEKFKNPPVSKVETVTEEARPR